MKKSAPTIMNVKKSFTLKKAVMPYARKFAAMGYDVFLTKSDWSGNWSIHLEGLDGEEAVTNLVTHACAFTALQDLPTIGGKGSIENTN